MSRVTSSIPPIHGLPNEILGAVFVQCLPICRDEWRCAPHPVHAIDAPLLLRRICRRWNLVAQATPELWSNVLINFSASADALRTPEQRKSFEENLESHSSAVSNWAQRAGNGARVTILMSNEGLDSLPTNYRNAVYRAMLRALEKVTASSSRWKALSLRLHQPYQSYILSLPTDRFKSLERFQFCSVEASPEELEATSLKCTLTSSGVIAAPNLTSLVLQQLDTHEGELSGLPVANWGKLTELVISGSYSTGYFAIPFSVAEVSGVVLRCAPSLVKLKLHLEQPFANDAEEWLGPIPAHRDLDLPHHVELPHLREVDITDVTLRGHWGEPPQRFQQFMTTLSTPRLQSLTFGSTPFPDWNTSSLPGFVQTNARCLSNLTSVKFAYNLLSPTDLLTILKTLGDPKGNISSLYMYAENVKEYFQAGVEDRHHAILWPRVLLELNSLFPKLEKISLRLGRYDEVTVSDLWDFVQRRLSSPSLTGLARLESVRAQFVPGSKKSLAAHNALMALTHEEDRDIAVKLSYHGACCWLEDWWNTSPNM